MKPPIPVRAMARCAEAIISIIWICLSMLIIVPAIFAFPGAVAAGAPNLDDAARGKELFEKRCGGCHSLDADKEGPHLRNVYGRKAASISSFKYSDALKGAQFAWDQNSLDKWLTDTESVIPDNDMDFHVPNPQERADIIEYLRVSSGH